MSYLGYDVLEINYNRLGDIAEQVHRNFVVLDSVTGIKTSDEHSPAPNSLRPFTWTAIGREEIAAMMDFLDSRKGRAVPFWLPSYQWDLSLAEDIVATQTIITINWVRYVQQLWGTTAARRHVSIWTLESETMDHYRISDAVDPGDYLTEILTLDPPAIRDYPVTQRVISFLKLCRLEQDLVEISHPRVGVAQATIQVREIPLEAPL